MIDIRSVRNTLNNNYIADRWSFILEDSKFMIDRNMEDKLITISHSIDYGRLADIVNLPTLYDLMEDPIVDVYLATSRRRNDYLYSKFRLINPVLKDVWYSITEIASLNFTMTYSSVELIDSMIIDDWCIVDREFWGRMK